MVYAHCTNTYRIYGIHTSLVRTFYINVISIHFLTLRKHVPNGSCSEWTQYSLLNRFSLLINNSHNYIQSINTLLIPRIPLVYQTCKTLHSLSIGVTNNTYPWLSFISPFPPTFWLYLVSLAAIFFFGHFICNTNRCYIHSTTGRNRVNVFQLPIHFLSKHNNVQRGSLLVFKNTFKINILAVRV